LSHLDDRKIVHHKHGGKFAPFLLTAFTDSEIEDMYIKYHPVLAGLTNVEKEDKIVDLVSKGELSTDKALVLSIKEGLAS